MTVDELNKFFRDITRVVTVASEVIEHHPNAPRPKGDYATVHVGDLVPVGAGDKGYSTNAEDLDEKVATLYDVMISVNFFRGDAQQNASILAGSMRRTSVITLFNAVGLGFTRPSAIRELTHLMDSKHEERAQIDLFVQFELTPIVELLAGIDSTRITGVFDNGIIVVDKIAISSTSVWEWNDLTSIEWNDNTLIDLNNP